MLFRSTRGPSLAGRISPRARRSLRDHTSRRARRSISRGRSHRRTRLSPRDRTSRRARRSISSGRSPRARLSLRDRTSRRARRSLRDHRADITPSSADRRASMCPRIRDRISHRDRISTRVRRSRPGPSTGILIRGHTRIRARTRQASRASTARSASPSHDPSVDGRATELEVRRQTIALFKCGVPANSSSSRCLALRPAAALARAPGDRPSQVAGRRSRTDAGPNTRLAFRHTSRFGLAPDCRPSDTSDSSTRSCLRSGAHRTRASEYSPSRYRQITCTQSSRPRIVALWWRGYEGSRFASHWPSTAALIGKAPSGAIATTRGSFGRRERRARPSSTCCKTGESI